MSMILATVLAIISSLWAVAGFNPSLASVPEPTAGIWLSRPDIPGSGKAHLRTFDRDISLARLAHSPSVFSVDGLLSRDDMRQLVQQGEIEEGLQRAAVWEQESVADTWRNVSQHWLRKDKQGATSTVRKLVGRVAALLGIRVEDVDAGSPIRLQRYGEGGRYFPRFDSSMLDRLEPGPQIVDMKSHAGTVFQVQGAYPHAARVATLMCILNNESIGGGSLVFPLASAADAPERPRPDFREISSMTKSNLSAAEMWRKELPKHCNHDTSESLVLEPRPGSCTLLFNHDLPPGGGLANELDVMSLHADCEVTKGVKWVMSWWLEARPPFAVSSSKHWDL